MIIEPGIKFGVGVLIEPPSILAEASIYYDMQAIIGSASDGTSVSSLINYGTEGPTYDATNAIGWVAPTVATLNGAKVLTLIGANLQRGYDIANSFTVTDGSLFMVAWTTAEPARILGFGGSNGSFFGFTQLDGRVAFFRNINDNYDLTALDLPAVLGLRVFGVVKTGSSVVYYDNNTIPVTYNPGVSGDFTYSTVGYRGGFGGQPSTGYLGDVAYYDRALSEFESARVVVELKSKYGIA
jgi:hypothetical protein